MVRERQLFTIFNSYVKPSSRYSLVHILSASSSQKVARDRQSFTIFYVKSSSRYSLVHIFSAAPQWSRETADTDTVQRRPRAATLPEKTQGLAPENVFSREFTRSQSLTLPNYLMMM